MEKKEAVPMIWVRLFLDGCQRSYQRQSRYCSTSRIEWHNHFLLKGRRAGYATLQTRESK
jgi:hypothetical protein